MQSVVAENLSTQDGGGLFNLGGEATIIQSAFVADSACRGGGVCDDRFDATRVSVVDSTLSGNEASINGGGISSIHGAETLVGHSTSTATRRTAT